MRYLLLRKYDDDNHDYNGDDYHNIYHDHFCHYF